MFGDEIERLYYLHPLTGEVVREVEEVFVFPATHYAAGPSGWSGDRRHRGRARAERLAELDGQNKLLEAQRLRMRTTYDIEMMRQVGFCSGIENYSMHIDGRAPPGTAPNCLLDYFPEDFLLVVDESHVDRSRRPAACTRATCPASAPSSTTASGCRQRDGQPAAEVRGVRRADRADGVPVRDARQLRAGQAAGGEFVEQVIRPTGLIDPEIVVKPTKGQIDDLVHEIRLRAEKNERVLVTTLTKKMSEDLTDYLLELGIRVRYLHSEVDTLRRIELLRELRMGEYDVLVGINLLREGLDLPEVSLVSILDADKEGFLRSGKSLIQTIGRAARNVSGQVHMYADKITPVDGAWRSTRRTAAVRSRSPTTPSTGSTRTPLRKRIGDITDLLAREARRHRGVAPALGAVPVGGSGRARSPAARPAPARNHRPRGVARGGGVSGGVIGVGAERLRAGWTSPRCRAPSWPT